MLLNDEELKKRIADLPGRKVTLSYIEERISNIDYEHYKTLTICIVTLDNGFIVTGTSACADPSNFNKDIGKSLAYKHAVSQLWPLFGFLLCEALFSEELNKK